MDKNYSRTAENFRTIKKDEDNFMTKNYSVLETKSRSPKHFTAFSPKHNDTSYNFYFKKDEKENIK